MKDQNNTHFMDLPPPPWLPMEFNGAPLAIGTGWTANWAQLWPFYTPLTFSFTKIVLAFQAAAGNFDAGIYDKNGTKIASLGSAAIPGTGRREFNLSATLSPDNNPHYFAYSGDNVGGNPFGFPSATQGANIAAFQYNASHPLPASFNLAAPTSRDPFRMIGFLLPSTGMTP